jgi:hypothetical protein
VLNCPWHVRTVDVSARRFSRHHKAVYYGLVGEPFVSYRGPMHPPENGAGAFSGTKKRNNISAGRKILTLVFDPKMR